MKLLAAFCLLCLLFKLISFTESGCISSKCMPNSASSSESSSSSSGSSHKDPKHTGLRVLMVAPNQFKSHYALNKKLALLLLEQTDWVEEVYMIIPNREGLVRDKDMEGHPEIGKRLHIEYFYNPEPRALNAKGLRAVYNDDFKAKHDKHRTAGTGGGGEKKPHQGGAFSGMAHQPKNRDGTPYTPEQAKKYEENLKKFNEKINTLVEDDGPGPAEAWKERDPKILRGTFWPFMLGLSKDAELIKAMHLRKFDVGIADVWDYAVFHFLYFSKVKHIVATSAQPIQSIYYDFMHFTDAIKHNPELWTATEKKATFDTREMGGKILKGSVDDNFEEKHKKSIDFVKHDFDRLNEEAEKICKEHKYVKSCKSYEELFVSAKYFFVNTQQHLDFRPTSPWPSKIVFFGGITLPRGTGGSLIRATQDKSTADALMAAKSKKGGLIVVSFGTLIKVGTMDKEIFDCFLAAFKRHQDYEFLWKVDKVKKPYVDLDAATKHRLEQMKAAGNIRPVDWFNQMDLLANERTTLFISHCGLNSVLEAAFQGTPLLCIPLTADQFYNAFAMQWRQTAIVVDKDQLVDKKTAQEKEQETAEEKQEIFEQKLAYFEGKLNEALNENKHKHLKTCMGILKTELNRLNPSKTFLHEMRKLWHN